MALYAIGDLHLSLANDKPMDVFGDCWKDHTEKLKRGFAGLREDDVTVLCGDLSWAMGLEEAAEDFRFIHALPGQKIVLKGNHDYWWSTASKAMALFQRNGIDSIRILNNNCWTYGDYAICGTRGWFFEEETGSPHDAKIMRREIMRLEASLKAAGDREKLVFLHYPPIFQKYECPEILSLLQEHRVRLCCYGHIHGRGISAAFNGWRGCTEFRLVSADAVGFAPVKLLDDPENAQIL
ncbi:MAG: metallophosphoesterase [Oscillospiraceae bacterium]|nr:metallophosphoesterase [Oscillospiraceae bacterium]